MAIITDLNCNLREAVKVKYLDGNLFSQDVYGNAIRVIVMDGDEPATLSGTVSGIAVRADGGSVAISDSRIDGNVATIVLPAAVYSIPGPISIVIKIADTYTVTTLAAVVTNVYQSSTDTVVDPGTIIPSINALIEQIAAAVATIPADYSDLWTSLAPVFSTGTNYTVGQYVTYDGGLYRFKNAHSGSWASADVDAVDLGSGITKNANDISDLKSAIDNFPDYLAPYQVFQNRLLTSGGWIIEYSDYTVAVCKIETNKLYRVVKVKGVPGQDGVRLGYSNTLYDGSTAITVGYKNSTTNVVEYYNTEYAYLYYNIKSVKTSEQVYNCYAYEIMEEQIDQLKTRISEVQGNVDKIDDITTFSLTKGYFINTAGTTVNYTLVADSGFDDGGCAVADCQPGDEFVIWGTGGNGGRLWCFVDSSGNVRDHEGANTSRSNYTIKAPSNTAKLVFNSKSAGSLCIKKQPPANRLTNLENEDEFIKSKIFKKVTLSSDSGFATGKAWNIYTNDWYTTANGANQSVPSVVSE